jgi:ankyrin repeat protein
MLVAIAVPAVAQFSEAYTFLKAVRERDTTKVNAIIDNPSSTTINARDNRTGDGALHIVTRSRDLTWLSFLLGNGARADLQNNEGITPLMIASQIGWLEGAQRLIASRANVNLANSRGETALILAVQQRQLVLVRLLMSRGANPNHVDSAGGYSAIEYARRDGRSDQILRLLQAPPRTSSPQTYGPTP